MPTLLHTISYCLLLWLLFPVIVVCTLAVALRDGSMRYLIQRLGYIPHATTAVNPLWIHCASVGETNAGLTFIAEWLKRHPDDRFVLTTTTITAAQIFAAHPLRTKGRHYYLPFDYPLFCRRFLGAVNPYCALIVETEIWLNLFSECRNKNIPLFLINARMSKRTLDGAQRFKSYYRKSLAAVTKVFARNKKDAGNFAEIGVEPDKIEILGNLKHTTEQMNDTTSLPNLIGKRYVLAASTHDDEEIQSARAWRDALNSGYCSDPPLLVITPRHPRRGRAIAQQLKKQGFQVQLRSRNPLFQTNIDVYIADTLGELPALILHADLVFMGGSLVSVGGHNVLEAARLGTPQVVGPYTHNFQEEVAALKSAGGLLEVSDEHALKEVFFAALNRAPEHTTIAKKALALMQQQADLASVYVSRVEAALALPSACLR